jgi:hypothetical protein
MISPGVEKVFFKPDLFDALLFVDFPEAMSGKS